MSTVVITRLDAGAPPVEAEPQHGRVHRAWRLSRIRVYVADGAMDSVWASVGRCPACRRVSVRAARERGGALAGRYAQSPEGHRFIVITDAVSAAAAPSSSVTIDIRVEDWQTIHRRIAALPGRRLLGWYHSQPGLGVRMSHVDLRTQRCLFAPDWQVGLVVDPLTGHFRFYAGGRARPVGWLAFVREPGLNGEAAAAGGRAAQASSRPLCLGCLEAGGTDTGRGYPDGDFAGGWDPPAPSGDPARRSLMRWIEGWPAREDDHGR